VRLGLRRGWTEFLLSVRSPQDQGFYLFTAVLSLAYLWFNRNSEVEGTGLSFPTVTLPGLLAALVAFGVFMGPVFALAMEREDGTLLRHKAVPHGMQGYVSGQLVVHSMSAVPQLLVVLVPSFLLFDGLVHRGLAGWLTVAWVVVLGMAAVLPWGMVLGAIVPSTQKAGTWGMLPVLLVVSISGIFVPLQQMWGWLQVVAQVFPVYWLGLGLRSAFLPDAAAAARGARAPRSPCCPPGASPVCWSPRASCGAWPAASPARRCRPPVTPRCSGCGDAGTGRRDRPQPHRAPAGGAGRQPARAGRRAGGPLPDCGLPRAR
jgi:ABC-2 type transport system permease protein